MQVPAVSPFNKYEWGLCLLVEKGIISTDQYRENRQAYYMRNRYLPLYKKSGGTSVSKALYTYSPGGFDMNFQQIKFRCADVFVWIGVWKDDIRYWILSGEEIRQSPYYSCTQHRGNIGEGQLWIKESNINEFHRYSASPRQLAEKIREKGHHTLY